MILHAEAAASAAREGRRETAINGLVRVKVLGAEGWIVTGKVNMIQRTSRSVLLTWLINLVALVAFKLLNGRTRSLILFTLDPADAYSR